MPFVYVNCIITPQAPPNFLRAAALAEYKKPVVVTPNEEHHEEEEDVEPQPEFREASQMPQVWYIVVRGYGTLKFHQLCVVSVLICSFLSNQYYLLNQMRTPDSSVEQREMENDSLKRELDVLKPELQIFKNEVNGIRWQCWSGWSHKSENPSSMQSAMVLPYDG